MIFLLASFLTVLANLPLKAEAEELWTPYVPSWNPIGLSYWKENGTSFMNLSITWGSSGFNVSDWGTPTIVENSISVNALIWRYGGITIPVLITEHHTYSLGNLSAGEYLFIFKAWGFPVKNTTFTVRLIVPDDYTTIQEAINDANEGDIVFVRNGTYYETVVVNKSICLIGEDSTPIISSNNTEYTIYVSANNVTVNGFEIQNHELGWGIILNHTFNCNINRNTVNATLAILVNDGSENCILNNSVVGGQVSCVFDGLKMVDSSRNVVSRNCLSYYCHNALLMFNSSNNYIATNYIAGHLVPWPITLTKSHNNSFSGNTVWPSFFKFGSGYMRFEESSDNVLYHNNFMPEPYINATSIDELSMSNSWDNGCEGNYWSNYNGTDLDGDGIGDTYLPWEGVDNYPLTNPYWNPSDINHDLEVDIRDVATAALAFGSYPGHEKWNPHADITGLIPLEPDDQVNIRDLALIAKNFGKEYNS